MRAALFIHDRPGRKRRSIRNKPEMIEPAE